MMRSRLSAVALALGLGLAPPAAAEPSLGNLQQQIIETAERVTPAVVHIEAIVKVNDRRRRVTGSGFIVSADGRILTNQHVVEKADKVTVRVPGRKRKYPARILGTDKQTDIALIQIDPGEPLEPAVLGSADGIEVGQWVLAIGNPYGLEGTVSFGIVSAKSRNLEVANLLNDFIQTDAMIDRGSSGGPLVDLEGRVLGINSRGKGRGIGFTIPIDTALEVVRQFDEGGIERGWLGITMQPLDRDLAAYFGVPDATGVVINSVSQDSPAEKAGLRPGDVLPEFDGTSIEAEKSRDLGSLQRRVAAVSPGEKTEMRILRDGKPRTLHARLGVQPTVDPEEEEVDAGFHVKQLTAHLVHAHRLSTNEGVFVHFVVRGSPASEAGLRPGDVIERIEATKIVDLDDLRRAMTDVDSRSSFLITARRGEETKFLLVKQRAAPPAPRQPNGDAGEAAHESKLPH